MSRKKVKLLSDHDVREVVKFQEFLRDKETMPLANFYTRYQEYMELSDEELKALLAKVTR